ncbi:MAG: P-loop NTPase fold protein [Methanobacterium sp.]
MFLPDKAIKFDAEDQLNRVGFAHLLAETIRDWKMDDSIVIGLFGAWGSGKSSLLNLTINYLVELTKNKKKETKPVIIWFNPWNFPDKEQLLRAFFQHLLLEIKKVDPKQSDKLVKGLINLGKALESFENLPKVGTYFSASRKFISLFIKDKSLIAEKENLDKLFKELNRRIVIIMDDIDRLTDEEIRLLFQIIKINADFPNTIYLVAFDRNVVEKALSNNQGIYGQEYLEKIVQVGFNIPIADQTLIQRFLFSELDKIIVDIKQEEFNQNRWASLYNHGYKDLFKSIRDVKRYINSLRMTFKSISHEVNPIDYLGIEALRVFLPEVYQFIAENKSLFLQESHIWNHQKEPSQEITMKLSKIFSTSEEKYKDSAKEISLQLFPSLNFYYQNFTNYSVGQLEWQKEKRICTEEFFDTYFLLGVPTGGVSQIEIDQIINSAANMQQIIKLFTSYYDNNRIRKLIVALSYRIEGLDVDQYIGLILASLTILSTKPDLKGDILDIGSDTQLSFFIQNLLFKIDPTRRFELFQDQIKSGQNLYALIYMVTFDLPLDNESRHKSIFSEKQLNALKSLCVESIEKQASEGSLLSNKEFFIILSSWKKWADNIDPLNNFIKFIRKTPDTFLKFLAGYIRETRSQKLNSYQIDIKKSLDLDSLFFIMSHEEIQATTKELGNINGIIFSKEQEDTLELLNIALKNIESKNDDQ